jgi:hypothetical protein
MRGGKPIVFIAIGAFVAWVLQPLWQWLFNRFLDSAARGAGGITGAFAKALVVTAPLHGFLLGVSVGMLLALTIGYWDQVRTVTRRWLAWGQSITWLLLESRARTKIAAGMFALRENEGMKQMSLERSPVRQWKTEIRWWPQAPVVCQIDSPISFLALRHRSETSPEIPIRADSH